MKEYKFFLTGTEEIYKIVEQHRLKADQEFRTDEIATLMVIQQQIISYDKAEARRICKEFERRNKLIDKEVWENGRL